MERKVNSLVERALEDLERLKTDDKWTVYAAIIFADNDLNFTKTVAMGSGTKCIPEKDVESHPEQLVHDCHAEIICRRAFNRFLLDQVLLCKSGSVLQNNYILFDAKTNRWKLRPDIKVCFFSSCSPCGDATIEMYADPEKDSKKTKIDVGLREGRDHPHLTGILRTKPGRKDSPITLSLSCSDKIASWNILGIQGAFLTHFFAPTYIDVLVFGAGFDLQSCTRSLISRTSSIQISAELAHIGFKNNSSCLKIFEYDLDKHLTANPTKQETSSFWFLGLSKPGHIVQGYKKGSKKPVKNQPFPVSLQSPLSRECFLKESLSKSLIEFRNLSYEEIKMKAIDYQTVKALLLKDKNFADWPIRSAKMKQFRENLLYNKIN